MAIINLKVINDKQNLYKRGNGKYIFSNQMYCVNVQYAPDKLLWQ